MATLALPAKPSALPKNVLMKRPNIIFIVADDLGYADLGCYGGRPASFGRVSPVIDFLSENGMQFSQGYANSPVCSPTRFALMTGRYQYRLRGAAEEPINSKSQGSAHLGLPPSHPTLPSLLQQSGYRTALFGKWHLGYPPAFGPLRSGYERFMGPMSGGVDYFTHCNSIGVHDLYLDETDTPQKGYLTDLISQYTVNFIEQMAGSSDPFFVSMHYTAPHWPWETREDEALAPQIGGRLAHLHGGSIHTYQRMIHHMDEGIGWVLDALRKIGQWDNTLVVFTSDNGGERFSDNWPLVGGKMDLTEGGIRVPWIAHWPAGIAAGSHSAQHCMTMDWTATMLDLAQVEAHPDYPLDGVSLAAVLRHASTEFERPLFWRMHYRNQRAMRQGRWKYLRVDDHAYLFDIEADARERANLASLFPEHLDYMRRQWEAWNHTMPPIPEDATVSLVSSLKNMPQR